MHKIFYFSALPILLTTLLSTLFVFTPNLCCAPPTHSIEEDDKASHLGPRPPYCDEYKNLNLLRDIALGNADQCFPKRLECSDICVKCVPGCCLPGPLFFCLPCCCYDQCQLEPFRTARKRVEEHFETCSFCAAIRDWEQKEARIKDQKRRAAYEQEEKERKEKARMETETSNARLRGFGGNGCENPHNIFLDL